MTNKHKNVPELRFKGFTDDWKLCALGELSSLRGGFAFSSEKFRAKGVPIVRISNILPTGEIGGDYVFYDEEVKDENYLLPNKAAVLAMSGATTGKVSILDNPQNKKIYQNQRVGYFTKKDSTDYGFVSTLVRSHLFINQLNSVLVAGAQPNVSSRDIDSFEFKVPMQIKEQQKIGLFFANLDHLITLYQRKLELLKEQKKAFLQKMFPKNGETVPELRFEGFVDAWEQEKLGNLAEIVRGASPRPIQDSKWFDDESEIGWLRISDVTEQDGRIRYLGQHISKLGQEKTRVLVEPHLLLSIAATVGKPVVNYVKTGVHDGFLIFQNPKFEQEFMFQWLEMFRSMWSRYGQPGSQVNLNSDLVKNQDIMIPTIEEQTKIGLFFKQLDSLITLHQRKLDLLKEQKKGFLQKMFV